MPFVVDASLAAAWVIEDEKNVETERLLEQAKREGAYVPDLFWHEMRNILLKIERRGRSTFGLAEVTIAILRRLPIVVQSVQSDATVLDLARTHSLTAYDASYLDIAILSGLPLATVDRALAAAARARGVPLLGPLAP